MFICVSTLVKFVAFRYQIPTQQLERIVSLPQNTAYEGRAGVDLLYTQILEQAADDVGTVQYDGEIYAYFRTVVGAVLLAHNPCTTLHSFHSLLIIPENPEDPIYTFHKSFHDFLTDPNWCKDESFLVIPSVHHAEVLLSCLRLIKGRLKRNICNLDDYAILSEVKDFSTQKKDHIGDALEYACQLWTKHLLDVPSDSPCVQEVLRAINQFFTKHFLPWIEVLVLVGNLDGVYAMCH